MNQDKWIEIREAHKIITDVMNEYRAAIDTSHGLLDSLDLAESRKELMLIYVQMRKLAHYANVQIARSGERLIPKSTGAAADS